MEKRCEEMVNLSFVELAVPGTVQRQAMPSNVEYD